MKNILGSIGGQWSTRYTKMFLHGFGRPKLEQSFLSLQDTYDEELLAAVAEVLPIMASALGPQTYGPVFQQLVFQPLMKRFQPGQPDGVRSTMIGQPLF